MKLKYTTENKLAENIIEQKAMNVSSLSRLLRNGYTENEFYDFDFYIYSNDFNKLSLLEDELLQLGYKTEEIEESSEKDQLFLSGTASSIQLNLHILDTWVVKMCEIAYKYDCEFSGWETQV